MERILSPQGATQRATDTHLSCPGASQAGGRLESCGSRRRGGGCRPGLEQRPSTAPPRDRQHEQADRINKWVPFGLPQGSGAQPRVGGRGAWEVLPGAQRLRAREKYSSGVYALAQLLVDRESKHFVVGKEQFRYFWIS